MAKWMTVAICDNCWNYEMGNRFPVRVATDQPDTCCRCKQVTRSGIYVRREIANDQGTVSG